MLFGGGLFAFAVLVLWVYCIFDVIATNDALTRNLPKLLWLLIVIFVPTIGSIAWLLLGRPERAGLALGGATYRAEPRSGTHDMSSRRLYGVLALGDDPRFIAELDEQTERLQRWEDDINKRQDELRRREEDNPPD